MKLLRYACILMALTFITSTATAKKYWDPPAGQGVSTVGALGDYTSLALAAADFVTSAPTGNWTIEILEDLTEPTNSWWGQITGPHVVTIKPAAGVTAKVTFTKTTDNAAGSGSLIIGTASDSWATLRKTDNFTIDGSNNGTDSRDLTFEIPATVTFAYNTLIHVIGDSDNLVIKNLNLMNLSAGTGSSISCIRLTSRWDTGVCYAPDGWLVQNNFMQVKAATQGHGMNITYSGTRGTAGINAAMKNNSIIGNEIYSRLRGIFINDGFNYTIAGNMVENSKGNNVTGFHHFAVFYNSTNGPTTAYHNIYDNYIYQESANTFAGVYGGTGLGLTSIGSGSNVVATVYNNIIVVKNVVAAANTNAFVHRGVYCTSGITYNFYNNSIHVIANSNLGALTTDAGCYGIGGWAVSSPVKIVNNVISVPQSSSSTTRGPSCIARSYSNAADVINNNALNANIVANGNIGFKGTGAIGTTTQYQTFAAWQGAGCDADGKELDPTSLWVAENDLHFNGNPGAAWKFGASVAGLVGLNKDYDGDNRDVIQPYVGADEPVSPNTTLTIVSAYGSPVPAVGVQNTTSGTLVNASVASPVAGAAGTRYVCTGFTGTGSAPASGTESFVTFEIKEPASITWNWKTQYQLTTAAAPAAGGSVSGAGWYDVDASAPVEATENTFYTFTGWSGDLSGSVNPTSVVMDAPKAVTANFSTPALNVPVVANAFGDKLVTAAGGAPEDFDFAIQNVGSPALDVNIYKESGSADFAIVPPAPATIAAGTTETLKVRYTPDTVGAVNAIFKVVTQNSATPSTVTLTLSGNGVQLTAVVGAHPALGAWDTALAPTMNAAAGLYTLTIDVPTTPTVWKVLKDKNAGWAAGNAVGRQADGGDMPDGGTSGTITYYYDTRDLSGDGWMPAAEGLGSTALKNIPWVVAGAFQGWDADSAVTAMNDDGLNGDAVAGDGIFTYQFQPVVALTDSEWVIVSNLGVGWGGEYKFGENGMAQDPGGPVQPKFNAGRDKEITVEYNVLLGRMRITMVTKPPLAVHDWAMY